MYLYNNVTQIIFFVTTKTASFVKYTVLNRLLE